MSPPPDTPTLRRITLGLIAAASALHIVQLLLYPVNPKWFVALAGSIVYSAATVGIWQNARYGYYLTTFFPLLAGVFVGIVLLAGPPPVPGGFQFNPFTAMAAVVEAPAVVLSALLIRRKVWQVPASIK